MHIIKCIFYFTLLTNTLLASERYICNQAKDKSNSLITNFYILENKLVMSGVSGNGKYKILKRNDKGLLAINGSFIGDEFGLETILLDNINKTFIYKSLISGKRQNNFVKIDGKCYIL